MVTSYVTTNNPAPRKRYILLISMFVSVLVLSSISIAQSPQEVRDLYRRGRQRYTRGDIDGAIADYTRAILLSTRLQADHQDGRENGKLKLGLIPEAIDTPAIGLLDPLTAAIYADRSLARFARGDLDGAMADCDRAIAIDPGLGTAYEDRGNVRAAKGDMNGAIADFSRAIGIDPRDPEAYNNRGGQLYKKGDVQAALADYDRAIALSPRQAEIYTNRAIAKTDQGDLDGAIADFERAIKLNPRLVMAVHGRGLARFLRKELEGSITDFSRAIELDPGFAQAYADRGLARLLLGQDAKAEEDFAQCSRLDPSLQAELRHHIEAAKRLRPGQASDSAFQFTRLPAQARPRNRAGFRLMPASSFREPSGPAFVITPMASAANLQVFGGGTLGRLTKWMGFTSTNAVIGDSHI
jgi:tetratricopeptide (TPR) repeat protein